LENVTLPALFDCDSIVFAPSLRSTYTSATFGTRLRFYQMLTHAGERDNSSYSLFLFQRQRFGACKMLRRKKMLQRFFAIVCKLLQCFFNAQVVAVESPGYGVFEGKPNETHVMEDAEKVVEHLRRELQ
jgi:hypothetical protein